jgi:hypothetical protein
MVLEPLERMRIVVHTGKNRRVMHFFRNSDELAFAAFPIPTPVENEPFFSARQLSGPGI